MGGQLTLGAKHPGVVGSDDVEHHREPSQDGQKRSDQSNLVSLHILLPLMERS
jgi:hypothetical protein